MPIVFTCRTNRKLCPIVQLSDQTHDGALKVTQLEVKYRDFTAISYFPSIFLTDTDHYDVDFL